ncbi:MAG: prephenate dehydratase [Chitinophagales bacterium]|nr:prephenate dehydratase [Chitinophagales bacterium]
MASQKKKTKVAIQGIAASFHEIAALTYFNIPVETVECLTFYQLCETLKNEKSDYAVMAIENTIAGSILPNYFLLQQNHFSIVGELYLPIHLHLLALPGVALKDIRSIESHPMAIRQCYEFLHSLHGIELKESDDTAFSAKRIKDLQLKDTAAIANEQAAKKFGLQILEKRIETNKKNFTRFLILTRRTVLNGSDKNSSSNTLSFGEGKGEAIKKVIFKTAGKQESNKASICFEVANEVGSLADALMTFKTNQINLTKIQSIPIIGKPNEYSIHVDVEWKRRKNYDDAIHIVMRQVRNLNVLGEYKKAQIKF